MSKINDILSAITIVKTRTGFRVDIQEHESNSHIEDLSFLMIIERTVKNRQEQLTAEESKRKAKEDELLNEE